DLHDRIAAKYPFTFSRAASAAGIDDLIAAEDAVAANLAVAEVQMQSIVTFLESDFSVPQLAPRADAGRAYTAAEGVPITLDGAASIDPNGTIAAWHWDLNLDGRFDDAVGATPTVTFAQAFDGLIGLEVTDNDGRTAIAYARITVADTNPRPNITAHTSNDAVLKVTLGQE